MRRALLAFAVFGAFIVPAGSTSAAECDGRVIERADGWTEIRPPAFSDQSGRVRISDHVTSGVTPDLMYVSNGASVQRSIDGGCEWTTVFRNDVLRVGQLSFGAQPDQVIAVRMPSRDPQRLYLLIEETTVAGTPRPVVLRSADGGTSFSEVSTGLPTQGSPLLLEPGLRRAVAYAAVTSDTGVDIYATTDAGGTWVRRGGLDADELTVLRVDPRLETRLWAVADETVLRSDDGGATFASVPEVEGRISALSVALTATSTRLVAARADDASYWDSVDDGDSWHRRPSPVVARSVAAAHHLDVVATTSEAGTFMLSGGRATDVTAKGLELDALNFGELGPRGVDLVARTPEALLRLPLTSSLVPRRGSKRSMPPVNLDPVPTRQNGEPRIVPARVPVSLQPGESRDVRLVLDLPPVPTPLDVVFLVDTTGSMGGTIAGLRAGIGDVVRDLAEAGIDARFGLGEFKDYPVSPYGSAPDFPYRLLRAVGPADDAYAEAIERLEAGGGGDGPESSYAAQYQAVTGAGDVAEDGTVYVERGQHVRFRAGSLRVFVVATDTSAHDEADYPGPSFDDTASALKRDRVLQMGLAVGAGARPDLEEMAVATGTLAPVGVDCDDDGRTDVRVGEPLVCDVGNELVGGIIGGPNTLDLAPAIIGLLRSVRDVTTLSYATGGPPGLLDVLTEPTGNLDLKQAHRLPFLLRATCAPAFHGTVSSIPVRAMSRGAALAQAMVDVSCSAPAIVAPVPAPQPPAPAAAPIVVAAAPPPPPPAQQPLPQTNPQGQPQPNPNPQAQAGVAFDEQEQTQLALAAIEVTTDDTELAMSASTRGSPSPVPLWAAGLALSVGAAIHLRRRERIELARTPVPPRE